MDWVRFQNLTKNPKLKNTTLGCEIAVYWGYFEQNLVFVKKLLGISLIALKQILQLKQNVTNPCGTLYWLLRSMNYLLASNSTIGMYVRTYKSLNTKKNPVRFPYQKIVLLCIRRFFLVFFFNNFKALSSQNKTSDTFF